MTSKSNSGSRIAEEDDYTTLDRLSLALNWNEAFESGSFTLCFWIYFLKSREAGVVIRQGRPNACAAIPFLTIDGDGHLSLFPSPPPDFPNVMEMGDNVRFRMPTLETEQTGLVQVTSSQSCQTERWIHVGCQLAKGWTRIYLNTELVAERETPSSDAVFSPQMETLLLSGGDGGGPSASERGSVRAFVHYARILPTSPSITNHFVKNPPYELNLVGPSSPVSAEDDGLEESGDGVWSVVGGKASCRRNFSLDAILVDAFKRSVDRDFDIMASLVFDDDGKVVERLREDAESPLLITMDGVEYPANDRPLKLIHGRAPFKLKISQLSSKCDNRLFRVCCKPVNAPDYPFLQAFSRPIRCISRNRTNRSGAGNLKRIFSAQSMKTVESTDQTLLGIKETKPSGENQPTENNQEMKSDSMAKGADESIPSSSYPLPFPSFLAPFPPSKKSMVNPTEQELPAHSNPFVSEEDRRIPDLAPPRIFTNHSKTLADSGKSESAAPGLQFYEPVPPITLLGNQSLLNSIIKPNTSDNVMNNNHGSNILGNPATKTWGESLFFPKPMNFENPGNSRLPEHPSSLLPRPLPHFVTPLGLQGITELNPHIQLSSSPAHATRFFHRGVGSDVSNPEILDPCIEMSNNLVMDYCLKSISQRLEFLQSSVFSIPDDQVESFANKVTTYTGCHHNGFQISIAKNLLRLSEEIWKSLSESQSPVLWTSMIMHLEIRFHRILSSESRRFNNKDKEFMQRLAGCGDVITPSQFDRLWKWLYPVALSLSSERMKQAWHHLNPVWIVGMISKEDAENLLTKEGMKKGKFLVRFASSRLWPHPDAGALVVSYVTDEGLFCHRLLACGGLPGLADEKDETFLSSMMKQPELSSLCQVDSDYNIIRKE